MNKSTVYAVFVVAVAVVQGSSWNGRMCVYVQHGFALVLPA